MGKAADNEAIKLDATFCNNIAVGLVVTSVFAPYVFVLQDWINAIGGGAQFNLEKYAGVFLASLAVAFLGGLLRRSAQKIVRQIED
jgi:hypothetical protein